MPGAPPMEGYLPEPIAVDPGGLIARQAVGVFHVAPAGTPIQHSPLTAWNPGTPYPGPPAVVQSFYDLDSARWWGRMGQGQLVWSEGVQFSADLPPNIDQQMVQHVDAWQRFVGGFPSIARRRPASFGAQVPVFDPRYPTG